MEVFGCVVLVLVVLGLGAGIMHSFWARRRPMMFAQATVVAIHEESATFRLFDGEELELKVDAQALSRLAEGNYGRLTYYADTFLLLERQSKP